MTLTSLLLLRTASATAAQAARRRRRELARELSAYSTPAELADLCAMLDRHDDRQTGEVRSILGDQERARAGARQLLRGGLPPVSIDRQPAGELAGWTEPPDPARGGRQTRTPLAGDAAHDWRRPPHG